MKKKHETPSTVKNTMRTHSRFNNCKTSKEKRKKLRKTEEAKVKEDTIYYTNMEKSTMTTRSGRKITSSKQDESTSTASDEKTTQTKTKQVRVKRGKNKATLRNHDASPYAKMTACGKKGNKRSVAPEKHTDEPESPVYLYSPQQLLIVTGPGRCTGKHNTIMNTHTKLASPPTAPPPPPSNTRFMDDSCFDSQHCPGGFYGLECDRKCPYPNYAKHCSQTCDCSEQKCNNIIGYLN